MNLNSRSLLAGKILLGTCLGGASSIMAQTVRTWNGGSGEWYEAARWSSSQIPDDASAEARIDGAKPGNAAVLLNSNNVTVGRLVVDAGDSLTISAVALIVTDTAGFGTAGTIVNNGALRVFHDPVLAGSGLVVEGDVSLTGSGTLTLDAAGDSYNARVADYASQAALTNHAGHTIAGRGSVSVTTLTNDGTMDANTAQGQSNRVLGVYGNTLVNHSLIRARNSGQLVVGASQVLNSGGQIRCDVGNSGENVTITGSHVNGGELINSTGIGSRFILENSVLDFVTLRGEMLISDQTYVILGGNITIPSGSRLMVQPDPLAGHGNIYIDGDPDGNGVHAPVVLQGAPGATFGGFIRLGENGNSQLSSDPNVQGHELINANLSIAGAGDIFLEKLTNNANGIIEADRAGESLALYSLFGGQWVNYGQMQAVSGGILNVNLPSLENKNGNGSLIAEAGSRVAINGTRILGGNVIANGTGQVHLNAAVLDGRPLGLTPDPVDVSGDVRFNGYTQLKGSIRTFGAATLTARQDDGFPYSSLSISRTVSLEGSGRVKLQQDPLVPNATAYIAGADADPGNILVLNVPVEGEGYIGNRFDGSLEQVEVNPFGAIKANLPDRSLELSYGTFQNYSALTAELGGTLKFERADVTNRVGRGGILPGQINALPGSTVEFGGILNYVTGGTIFNGGGNVLINGHVRFYGVTIAHLNKPQRTVDLQSGSLTLALVLENFGQIHANEFGGIYIEGDTSLIGTGSLDLDNADIYGVATGATLIQGPGHSLTGRGTIHCGFVNNGRVVVPDNQTATFSGTLSGSGSYRTNRGVIRSTSTTPVTTTGSGSGVYVLGQGGLMEANGYQVSGGGGLIGNAGGTVVALGGNNIVGTNAGALVGLNGSNIVANGGGNVINGNGSTLVGLNGSNIIANGGGNIIANGGNNFQGGAERSPRDDAPAGTSRVLLGDGSMLSATRIEIQTNAVLEITAGDPNADPENFVFPPDTISYGNVVGTFDLQTGGAWVADIGGTVAGQSYDQLTVTGDALLDGELRVRMLNDFQQAITAANTFTILTATEGVTGLPSNTVSGRITTSDMFGTFAVSISPAGTGLVLSDFQALPHPILAWAAGFGLTGADAQMSADPDHDGRNNLEEFAYLTNPANGGNMPEMPMERVGDQIVISFTRRCGASHRLSYTAESTTNLTAWLSIASPWTETIIPLNNETETVTISGPASTERSLFRLRVTGL